MSVETRDNPASRRTTANVSIGAYLIQRLRDYGIDDIFGIPGDYVLSFYSELEKSAINVVGCTREDCAGFAADAYSRLNGMGALCVTYCVGGLSACNSIAGAYAEKSPVVVISGSPGLGERKGGAKGKGGGKGKCKRGGGPAMGRWEMQGSILETAVHNLAKTKFSERQELCERV